MNPADNVTRPVSFKQLQKSNYLNGPKLENLKFDLSFIVPNVINSQIETHVNVNLNNVSPDKMEHLIPLDRYSSFSYLVKVYVIVMKCIKIWKAKIGGVTKF